MGEEAIAHTRPAEQELNVLSVCLLTSSVLNGLPHSVLIAPHFTAENQAWKLSNLSRVKQPVVPE